ncbi:MAG: thioredoxin family protein [Myxococcales bacterium]|nr:thioredoxin family protein [Myxococcales bacterium]
MVRTLSTMLELDTTAPEFDLPNFNGEPGRVRRADYLGRPLLVMFICNHCPYVIHLADELSRFADEYIGRGLAIVAINANDVDEYPQDGPEKMRDEATRRGYRFPYLYDESQAVARAYRAACTPDFFLFDADHRLAYRGQFDETRPRQQTPQTPTGSDLRAAADAVLAGRPVEIEQRPSLGCNIKWREGNSPDYFPN